VVAFGAACRTDVRILSTPAGELFLKPTSLLKYCTEVLGLCALRCWAPLAPSADIELLVETRKRAGADAFDCGLPAY
jgi:hypothetical protein